MARKNPLFPSYDELEGEVERLRKELKALKTFLKSISKAITDKLQILHK